MRVVEGTLKRRTELDGQTISFITKDIQESDRLFSQIKDKPLEVIIKPVRKKRSLNANAYYWTIVTKVAEINRSSTTEIHNIMLGRYGTPITKGGRQALTFLPDDIDYLKDEFLHLKPTDKTREIDGKLFRWWMIMKGSSEYDTAEMSRLIDGAVSEAQELGIETATPDEVERMKKLWRRKNETASVSVLP